MKNKRGITLIALIITIIILLIIAGISITALTGENGLLDKALNAKESNAYSSAEEKVKIAINGSYSDQGKLDNNLLKINVNSIDGIKNQLIDITYPLSIEVDGYNFKITENGKISSTGKKNSLPANTASTSAGTEVALDLSWSNQTMRTLSTVDGTEIQGILEVATVYAVSAGNGDTVPVPYDFYYVGGTLNSGVVISDNQADKNKYAGQDTVGTDLQGNQFVWIPCLTSEYKKDTTSWASKQNAYYDTKTPISELSYIEKYSGFYVGRYEAGLDLSKAQTTSLSYGSNYHDSETAKPQSKQGLIPWTFVSWNTANTRAHDMYSGSNYVSSGLVTGTQWDVMLNKIIAKTGVTAFNSNWGNNDNTSVTYTGPASEYNVSNNTQGVFTGNGGTTNSSLNTKLLLTTGASIQTSRYNIFDVAGNAWEWTDEVSLIAGNSATQYHMKRGGAFYDSYVDWPVCCRNGDTTVETFYSFGYRVSLFIK